MSLNDKGQAADPKDRLTEARAKLVMAQIVDGLIYLPQGLPWGQQSPPLPPACWGPLPVWREKPICCFPCCSLFRATSLFVNRRCFVVVSFLIARLLDWTGFLCALIASPPPPPNPLTSGRGLNHIASNAARVDNQAELRSTWPAHGFLPVLFHISSNSNKELRTRSLGWQRCQKKVGVRKCQWAAGLRACRQPPHGDHTHC